MGYIVLLLFFFNKDGFGIKYPTQVDMLLKIRNKEIETWPN